MCTTCSECVADVYVGVKSHLCNIHTRPCTSAHNTCEVHVTLTAKKCTYIYTYTQKYTHAYAHKNTCACMTPSTYYRGGPVPLPKSFLSLHKPNKTQPKSFLSFHKPRRTPS